MKLKPILTEKSMQEAKEGRYSFWVPSGLVKGQIRRLISEVFGVKVKTVRTINYKSKKKMNLWKRKKIVISPRKKTVVTLAEGEKIDVFGEGK